ncbi:hypothetical protein [Nonomuraea sp. NPDC050310]|uniref:hypothetical protein n=1 Tax=Nonomuraea sp. NPDC050310 TaxID=3154935 RepID=UPI00340D72D5
MNRVLLVPLALLTIAGCAMQDQSFTQQQALARVEQLIRDTAAEVTPRPRLELVPYGTEAEECPSDAEANGRVTVNRAYWLRDVPRADLLRVSRQVRAAWERQGHRLIAAGDGDNPDLSGESQPDRYTLALTWADGDQLYLAATSPCIWPDGTPSAHRPPRSNR